MNPAVLITRPSPDAEDFAAAVKEIGYVPLIDPLLTATYYATLPVEPPPQAIVATSAHAFATPAPAAWVRLPVFVMGQNSAQAARAAGYQNILSANGKFTELLRLLERTLVPAGEILYLRGETIRHDLKMHLPRSVIREQVVYAMQGAELLADTTRTAIRSGTLDTVTLFSARTAQVFSQLVGRQALTDDLRSIKVLCLSAAVLESVDNLPWRHAEVAGQPDRHGMLAVLKKWME